jgi:hypothetical protein
VDSASHLHISAVSTLNLGFLFEAVLDFPAIATGSQRSKSKKKTTKFAPIPNRFISQKVLISFQQQV